MTNLTRICPKCQKEIQYKSLLAVKAASKKKSKCKSCGLSGSNNPMYGKTGDKNPFFGKHHSEASKDKFRLKMKGRPLSLEHATKVILAGKKNIVQGNIYLFWLEKYGKDEADRRLAITKAKHSKNNSGAGNPMYGKPSPQGSGNGWSGWYKDWFFRSLRELKYVLELDDVGIPWKSAESREFQVPYVRPTGNQATYFPDFLVDDKLVVECKPQRLWETPTVKAKTNAAKAHFARIGLEYQLVDPGRFDDNRFNDLVERGIIILTDRYKKRHEERKNEARNNC